MNSDPEIGGWGDNSTQGLAGYMADVWIAFPSGTSDGQNNESGDDGKNCWDYVANETYPGSESELYLNCLDAQDPD